jgi:nucleotide-binding universal stress UspA family protein
MHILIPLDGSELAEYSIGQGAHLVRDAREPSRMTLLRIVTLPSMISMGAESAFATAYNAAVEAAGDYLREVALRPSLHGLQVDTRAETSTLSVPEAIIAQAKDLKADLIFMTSHGRSGIARAILGSVAEDVARSSPVPTLIVRVHAIEERTVSDRPFAILVALDESSFAEYALAPAIAIARAVGGEIVLFESLPSPSIDPAYDRDRIAQAEHYLEQVSERLKAQGVTAKISLASGDPATRIIERAQREDSLCDLIALATHARSGPEKFFLGSVADDVLRHTHRPILIVHPPDLA